MNKHDLTKTATREVISVEYVECIYSQFSVLAQSHSEMCVFFPFRFIMISHESAGILNVRSARRNFPRHVKPIIISESLIIFFFDTAFEAQNWKRSRIPYTMLGYIMLCSSVHPPVVCSVYLLSLHSPVYSILSCSSSNKIKNSKHIWPVTFIHVPWGSTRLFKMKRSHSVGCF